MASPPIGRDSIAIGASPSPTQRCANDRADVGRMLGGVIVRFALE
jgi:hypothetical protein